MYIIIIIVRYNIYQPISLRFTPFPPSSPRALYRMFSPVKVCPLLHRMSARRPPWEMVKNDKFEKKIHIVYKLKNL